jgi:hypothetical protein
MGSYSNKTTNCNSNYAESVGSGINSLAGFNIAERRFLVQKSRKPLPSNEPEVTVWFAVSVPRRVAS